MLPFGGSTVAAGGPIATGGPHRRATIGDPNGIQIADRRLVSRGTTVVTAPRRPPGGHSDLSNTRLPSRSTLIIILLGVVIVGLLAVLVLTRSSSRTNDDAAPLPSDPPVVAANTCSAEGLESLLPGLDADQATLGGDPTCQDAFAVLPLVRTTGEGSEEQLVAAFHVTSEGSWEHFATVLREDCIDLEAVETGFPATLCNA